VKQLQQLQQLQPLLNGNHGTTTAHKDQRGKREAKSSASAAARLVDFASSCCFSLHLALHLALLRPLFARALCSGPAARQQPHSLGLLGCSLPVCTVPLGLAVGR